MIVFPFEKRYSRQLGSIWKPMIPVTLIGPKRSVKLFMLLDSGADLSLVPYSVGEALGLELDIQKRSEIQGIGEGSVPYILSQGTLQIGKLKVPIRIGWALIEEVPLILGRLDVFRHFAVEFREFEDKIVLKPHRKV